MLKDIFGFSEQQQKATFGLGYKLPLTRKTDNSVLDKDNATNIGKVKIINIEWYVPQCTPSIPQQSILSKQILSKRPTEHQYVERCFFWKPLSFKSATQTRLFTWNVG